MCCNRKLQLYLLQLISLPFFVILFKNPTYCEAMQHILDFPILIFLILFSLFIAVYLKSILPLLKISLVFITLRVIFPELNQVIDLLTLDYYQVCNMFNVLYNNCSDLSFNSLYTCLVDNKLNLNSLSDLSRYTRIPTAGCLLSYIFCGVYNHLTNRDKKAKVKTSIFSLVKTCYKNIINFNLGSIFTFIVMVLTIYFLYLMKSWYITSLGIEPSRDILPKISINLISISFFWLSLLLTKDLLFIVRYFIVKILTKFNYIQAAELENSYPE